MAGGRGSCAGAAGEGCGGHKLLCVGDSHTEAIFGTDWVGRLQKSLRGRARVMRAGKGGEWAVLIRRRLDQLLASHPNAGGVVILAGTNDVIATLSPTLLRLYHRGFPALGCAAPSAEAYAAEVERMLAAAGARLPGALVAVVTLPPVGEDLADAANDRVRQYNEILAAAAARHPNARLVGFHAACAAHLEARPGRRPPPGVTRVSALRFALVQVAAALQRYLLRWSWDAISRANGLCLLTDQVHLNDTAGALLLQTLQPFVDELLAS